MIPLFKVHMPETVTDSLSKVFDSGMITEGEFSDKFEIKFGDFIDNNNTCLVNSCTSALTLAYRMCDLKPGDEIIVTPLTCMATNEPAHLMGAKLVWADIDPSTGNICPDSVRERITSKTKIISAVHWAGQPFEIDEINEIAKQCGAKVVEDAAHALGASYKGKLIGSHSDYTCFSFQAIKHLTTGDGGAISCLNKEEADRIRKLRWFGLDRNFKGSKWTQDIYESGYKFHMNNINASIGLEQMKHIDEIINKHKKNSLFFDEHINNNKIEKLKRNSYSESASWIYTLKCKNRNKFQDYLLKNGIQSDPVHVRNDKYSVFK
ncbi:MAG: DegT/DnrJ/EryC1/StrS family aminotransferase, partial [Candidatus Hodarchaeales archaeon]